MKDKVAYILLILAILIGIPYQAGFFQDSLIKVNDIEIQKLPLSQYVVIYEEGAVDKKEHEYRFKQKGAILLLEFKNYFTYSETKISFGYVNKIKNNFNKKCQNHNILFENDRYQLTTSYYSNNLLIHFSSDNKEDLDYFYRQICE